MVPLIKSRLKIRGIRINPPAVASDVENLQKLIGNPISKELLQIFELFDGFDGDFGVNTFIGVWPIHKIIAEITEPELPYIPFADRAFNAEVFWVCATDATRPILCERELAFKSYSDFWDYFLDSETPE